jgi:inorganic triphosphatase YgiF
MKMETEVKFTIADPATFSGLKQISAVAEFRLESIGTKITRDRYLASADKRLFRAGYACRIRSVQQKKILTLKSLNPPQDEIHRRQEIEAEVSSEQPELWSKSEARDLVLSITASAPLHTLFIINQIRHKHHVMLNDEAVIELSLDEVSMNEAATTDYFELEAELMDSGTETDLTRFVVALQADWGLQPEARSKFERGLQNLSSGLPAR